jgi:hypothetical protein
LVLDSVTSTLQCIRRPRPQACSVRGSRQGPRRTPREAVRLQSPACARKWAAAELLPECVVSQLVALSAASTNTVAPTSLGQQQLSPIAPSARKISGAGSPEASSQQPQQRRTYHCWGCCELASGLPAPEVSRRQLQQEGVCVFITAVPNTKLCAWGEEDNGGHVL